MALGDPLQLVIIAVIVIVVFLWGPKKIPELARALGRVRKEYGEGAKESATSASGSDALVETARKLGISTDGKTREQISDEIVRAARPPAAD